MKVIFICTALITSLVLMGFREKPHLKQHALNKRLYKELEAILQKAGSAYGEIRGPTDGVCLSYLEIQANLVDKEVLQYEEAVKTYNIFLDLVIRTVNQNSHYRPYLAEYPFSRKNVSVELQFINSATGSEMGYPKIGRILSFDSGVKVLMYKNGEVIQVQKPGAK